jgi:hypothetical protein
MIDAHSSIIYCLLMYSYTMPHFPFFVRPFSCLVPHLLHLRPRHNDRSLLHEHLPLHKLKNFIDESR